MRLKVEIEIKSKLADFPEIELKLSFGRALDYLSEDGHWLKTLSRLCRHFTVCEMSTRYMENSQVMVLKRLFYIKTVIFITVVQSLFTIFFSD